MNPDDILDRFSDLIDALDGREIPDDIVLMEGVRDEAKRLREVLRQIPEMVRCAVENYCQHPSDKGQERCACDDIMDEFKREFVAVAEREGAMNPHDDFDRFDRDVIQPDHDKEVLKQSERRRYLLLIARAQTESARLQTSADMLRAEAQEWRDQVLPVREENARLVKAIGRVLERLETATRNCPIQKDAPEADEAYYDGKEYAYGTAIRWLREELAEGVAHGRS